MKNAHLRFGHLIYTKALKKTMTRFKVPLDRFIGEPESNSVAKAHLISVIGGDTQIAGLAAAVANNDSFTLESGRPNCSSRHLGCEGTVLPWLAASGTTQASPSPPDSRLRRALPNCKWEEYRTSNLV